MLILPAIDLRNGRCVRLTQGLKSEAKIYTGEPLEIALSYENDGAKMLHIVDLDGAFAEKESPNRNVVREIVKALNIPVQFGGGLRSIEDVKLLAGFGVNRLIIGTLAIEQPKMLEELIKEFGAKIAVGIDAKNGFVTTRGWEKQENVLATDLTKQMAKIGVERIIYTDIAKDGMLEGVNIEQTVNIAKVAKVKVTASGGVSSLEDIRKLKEFESAGIDSVIIGKAIYEKRFTLKEALEIAENKP